MSSDTVVLAKSRHLASLEKPEGGEASGCRLCKHCGYVNSWCGFVSTLKPLISLQAAWHQLGGAHHLDIARN